MTDATTPPVPAGWYSDPAGGSRLRWWDGTQWTDHFQEPYSTVGQALKAPEGTRWNTVWIWLIVLLPLLNYIPYFFIDWSQLLRGIDLDDPSSAYTGQLELMTSPAYLLSSVGGWVVYGLSVLFAYLDWRQLNQFGVPKPFHWAFAFIPAPVYPIGRSIVVQRRTGRGISPMWVTIATLVLGVIAGIYITASVMSAVFSAIPGYTN